MTGEQRRIRYRRLPGRRSGIFHRTSLWLGDDHLLAVSGWRFIEDYKRYYYRDIQAIVTARVRRYVITVPWILTILGLAIAWIVSSYSRLESIRSLPPLALVGVLLYLATLSQKRSCRCRIQTAVSYDELPSLFRLRSVFKALPLIESRIAEAQGSLPEGWAPSAAPSAEPQPAPGVFENVPDPGEAAARRPAISLGEAGFHASLLLGASTTLVGPLKVLWPAAMALIAATAILLFVSRRKHPSKFAHWYPLAVLIFLGCLIYGGFLFSVMEHAVKAAQAGRAAPVARLDLHNNPIFGAVFACSCLGCSAFGLGTAWLLKAGR